MSDREKSLLAHSGAPLRVASNIARRQPVAVPWLETFSTRPAGSMEQKNARHETVQTPGGFAGDEDDAADGSMSVEEGRTTLSGFDNSRLSNPQSIPVQTKMLERHGQTDGGATPMMPAQNPDLPEQSKQDFTANMKSGVDISGARASSFNESKIHDQRLARPQEEPRIVRPEMAQQKVPTDRQSSPRIVVKKTIEITAKSSMRSLPEFRQPQADRQTGHFPSEAPVQSSTVEDSLMRATFYGKENPGIAGFSSASSDEASHMQLSQTEFLQMDSPVRTSQSGPTSVTGQADVLQRLNQQSSREQTQKSPKRVHIGNVHITVQRPGSVSAQQPAPNQMPAPSSQPAQAAQVFMNPWDRMYTVLD